MVQPSCLILAPVNPTPKFLQQRNVLLQQKSRTALIVHGPAHGDSQRIVEVLKRALPHSEYWQLVTIQFSINSLNSKYDFNAYALLVANLNDSVTAADFCQEATSP